MSWTSARPVARRGSLAVTLLLWVLAVAGCVPRAAGPPTGTLDPDTGVLPSRGFGTLRQEEVSILIETGGLRMALTPLAESVTRVTAPDTERRLSGLAASRADLAPPDQLFLVSFFSDQPEVAFLPEEVQVSAYGIRSRPAVIDPVTATWGEHRVGAQRTEMAVYRFEPPLDLESDLVLSYGLAETASWAQVILPRIRAESARARAREGVGSRCTSSSVTC